MTIVRFLHVLAMAFFVGGQLFLVAAVVPVMRGGDREPLRAVARRFGLGSLVAVVVLLLTGAAMASDEDAWGEGLLHVKLTLVVIVAGLVHLHMRRPDNHAIEGAIFVLSLAIVWLGLGLAH